jgi:hypothetical protein
MYKQKLTDELSDLRTQIMRLQHRESLLQDALTVADADATAHPNRRPGWPIRRLGDQGAAMH